MDSDLARSLFDSARERLDVTGRWSALAVLALLVLYLATLQPFLEARRALEDTRGLTQTLRRHGPELEALGQAITGFRNHAEDRIRGALEDLLDAKVKDFQALGLRVAALQRAASGQPPDAAPPSTVQTQGVDRTGVDPSRIPPLPPETAEQVRQAPSSLETLREILRPYIETHIVEPRFAAINNRLREEVAPDLRGRLEALRARAREVGEGLRALEGRTAPGEEGGGGQGWVSLWKQLDSALDSSERKLASLTVKPPGGDPGWWYSVAAKMRTLDELGRTAVEDLRTGEVGDLAKTLSGRLDQALRQQDALAKALTGELEALKEQFETQQKQMTALGQPFASISLDLATTAGRLPLLLALVLSALSLGRSQRLRQLGLALPLLPDRQGLWSWYLRRGAALPRGAQDAHHLLLAGLGELTGTLAWAALVLYQVGGEPAPSTLLAVLGLPLAAYAYRQWVVREVAGSAAP
jgi:hypothetical protein